MTIIIACIILYGGGDDGTAFESGSNWVENDAHWNIAKKIDGVWENDVSLTLVLDPTITNEGSHIIQTIYKNGEYLDADILNRDYYNHFLSNSKTANCLEFGRSVYVQDGNWYYMKGLCYTLRIYNRALSGDEVRNNYESASSIHELLKNN